MSSGTYVRALARDLGAALGVRGPPHRAAPHPGRALRPRRGAPARRTSSARRRGEPTPVTPLAEAARGRLRGARASTPGGGPRPRLRPAHRARGSAPGRGGGRYRPRRHPGRDARRVRSHSAHRTSCSPRRVRRVSPCTAGPNPPETPEAPAAQRRHPRQLRRGPPRAPGRARRPRRARATDRGLPSVAVTFDPHPVAVLHPEQAPELIAPGGRARRPARRPPASTGSSCSTSRPSSPSRPRGVRRADLRATPRRPARRRRHGHPLRLPQLRRRRHACATLGAQHGFDVVVLDDVGEGERWSPRAVRTRHLAAGEVGDGRAHPRPSAPGRRHRRPRRPPRPRAGLPDGEPVGRRAGPGPRRRRLRRVADPARPGRRRRPTAPCRPPISRRHQPDLRRRRPAHRRGLRARPHRPRPLRRAGRGRVRRRTSGRRCGSRSIEELLEAMAKDVDAVPRDPQPRSSRPDPDPHRAGGARRVRSRPRGAPRVALERRRWLALADVGLFIAAARPSLVGALLVWSATRATTARPTSCATCSHAAVGMGLALRSPGSASSGVRVAAPSVYAGSLLGLLAVLTPLGLDGQRLAVVDPAAGRLQRCSRRSSPRSRCASAWRSSSRSGPSAGSRPDRRDVALAAVARGRLPTCWSCSSPTSARRSSLVALACGRHRRGRRAPALGGRWPCSLGIAVVVAGAD